MSRSGIGFGFIVAAFIVAGCLAMPRAAQAITYGQPDCQDNATNTNCLHPNTVSLSGFRAPNAGEQASLVSSIRCSGSLLSVDEFRFVILTAGHCASAYLSGLQGGSLVDLGVSFDAEIVRDLAAISPTVWSPAQYILGGQPVLNTSYGRQGAKASNIQFDYAVVVFDRPTAARITEGGTLVDVGSLSPVQLPPQDYLVGKVSATQPLSITAVGYGTGEAHNKPGEGGNTGGAVNATDTLGVRWYTDLTRAFSFMGPEANLLLGSQNPARGDEGTCGGDSGGPLFYDDKGVEIQVGITSSGDAICRATSIIARTDGTRAVEFLSCASAPGAGTADILDCGCTEVNSQGECGLTIGTK
jgi:hypothetical protein